MPNAITLTIAVVARMIILAMAAAMMFKITVDKMLAAAMLLIKDLVVFVVCCRC